MNEPNVKPGVRKVVRSVFGIILILLGTGGHFIPLLPGSFIIITGLLLLAENLRSVCSLIERMESKRPAFHAIVIKVRREDGSLRLSKILLIGFIITSIFSIAVYLFVQHQ